MTKHRVLGVAATIWLAAALLSGCNLRPVMQIDAGDASACAVIENHTVHCWGVNDVGQLGNGQGGPNQYSLTQVSVVGLDDAVSVSVGYDHACAVRVDATVSCWGHNLYGELGDGTRTNRTTPVAVTGLAGVQQVSAGTFFTCALLDDGTVWCWGKNGGLLGDGTTGADRVTPGAVTGIDTATEVSSGSRSSCALLEDTTAVCWGKNQKGELGDGTFVDHATPVAVSGLVGVTQLDVGKSTACAVTGGAGRCWGEALWGKLGNSSSADSSTPVAVAALVDLVEVSVGGNHVCGLLGDGTVACWGQGGFGALGSGDGVIVQGVPAAVSELSGVTGVSMGAEFSCASKADATAWCWGHNSDGRLGDGTREKRTTPVAVVSAPPD